MSLNKDLLTSLSLVAISVAIMCHSAPLSAQSCGMSLEGQYQDQAAFVNDIGHLRMSKVKSLQETQPCDLGKAWCKTGTMKGHSYRFDKQGRLTFMSGYSGETTVYRYKGLQRFAYEEENDGAVTVFERDADGAILKSVNRKYGITSRFLWSKQGNALVVRVPDDARPYWERGFIDGKQAWC